jgi:hypothetical protein
MEVKLNQENKFHEFEQLLETNDPLHPIGFEDIYIPDHFQN